MNPDRLYEEWVSLGGASTGISFFDFQRQYQMGLNEMGRPNSGLGKEQEGALHRALNILDSGSDYGKENRS